MNETTRRRLALLDIVGITVLLECYIWVFQERAPRTWILFPIWLAASFLVQGDTLKTLGWRVDNLWPASRRAATVFGAFAAPLLAIGYILRAPTPVPMDRAWLSHLLGYVTFCLLQQVALNSLFTNRLLGLLCHRRQAAIVAGAIFAAAHWPNPVLVPATFIGGTAMAWLFARERNILPLALGQAILGLLVAWAFPMAWHHGLRVGPGYSHFR